MTPIKIFHPNHGTVYKIHTRLNVYINKCKSLKSLKVIRDVSYNINNCININRFISVWIAGETKKTKTSQVISTERIGDQFAGRS